jgi:hypothetical protein
VQLVGRWSSGGPPPAGGFRCGDARRCSARGPADGRRVVRARAADRRGVVSRPSATSAVHHVLDLGSCGCPAGCRTSLRRPPAGGIDDQPLRGPGPARRPGHPPRPRPQPPGLLAAGRMVPQIRHARGLLAVEPARPHPVTELVRLAKICWRTGHDYRELKTGPRGGPLRGALVHRPAPPGHPRRPRPGDLHPAPERPQGPLRRETLYGSCANCRSSCPSSSVHAPSATSSASSH